MNQTRADAAAQLQKDGQKLMLIGVGLVMGGCVFGGLMAVALHLLRMTPAAGVVAIAAGVAVLIGVGVQVSAYRKLNAAKASSTQASSGKGG